MFNGVEPGVSLRVRCSPVLSRPPPEQFPFNRLLSVGSGGNFHGEEDSVAKENVDNYDFQFVY